LKLSWVYDKVLLMQKLTIIYYPQELGAQYGGTNLAPELIKNLGLEQQLTDSNFDIVEVKSVDCGNRQDLQPLPEDRPFIASIIRSSEQAAEITDEATKEQSTVVTVGGDHTVNLGVFSGAATATSGDIGMIYIDAHGDMNTPESSSSHNVHGMHLAALLGHGTQDMVNVYKQGTKLKPGNLLHVGGKDLDQFEIDLIKSESIATYSVDDVVVDGLKPLFRKIDELVSRVNNIWVSFDLDSIDQQFAPGVGIPNRGGLSYRESMAICDYIAKTCNLTGLDVVECNPPKDVDNNTSKLAIEVILRLLGSKNGQYAQYMKNI